MDYIECESNKPQKNLSVLVGWLVYCITNKKMLRDWDVNTQLILKLKLWLTDTELKFLNAKILPQSFRWQDQ